MTAQLGGGPDETGAVPPGGSGSALQRSEALTCVGVAPGCAASSKAVSPLATAAAWLVPEPRNRPFSRWAGVAVLRQHGVGGQQAEHVHTVGDDVRLLSTDDAVAAAERRDRPTLQVGRTDGEDPRVEARVADGAGLIAGRDDDGDAGVAHPVDHASVSGSAPYAPVGRTCERDRFATSTWSA